MPTFKRLVAQVHDVEADTPAQADEVARIRADAVNAGMRVLGHGTAWAVTVLDSDSEEGGLTDILQDAYLLDEIDDNPERNPRTGYVALDETIVFEKLLAWRDAAVKAADDRIERAMHLHRSDAYGKCVECSQGYECGDWAPDWPCGTWLALESPQQRAQREADEAQEAHEKALQAAIKRRDEIAAALVQARAATRQAEEKRDAIAAELAALESE